MSTAIGSEDPWDGTFDLEGGTEPAVQKLACRLVEDAHARGASEIHVEPGEGSLHVRYRVGGNLEDRLTLPRSASEPLVARLKAMAELDVTERNLPQAGRIEFRKFSSSGLDLTLELATIPAATGEQVVLWTSPVAAFGGDPFGGDPFGGADPAGGGFAPPLGAGADPFGAAVEGEPRDRVAALFEAVETDTPADVRAKARSLATAWVGKSERLPLAPGDSAGPYEIVRILGAGGQAVVYEGRHRTVGRRVALKVPRRELGDRLLREARIMARLEHPSIVRVEDLALDGPVPYLVLELCEGGSLEDRLEGAPDGLPLVEVRAMASAILEALAFAHEKGVVHRDVKPGNVLFDARGAVKVADFGIGSLAQPESLSVSHDPSQVSLLAGTPLYLSPEHENPALREGGALDGRSDLFSFGKVLFVLLTGASPRTIRPASRLRKGLDPAWDEYVFRLTEEKPARRFSSARAALAALPPPPVASAKPSGPGVLAPASGTRQPGATERRPARGDRFGEYRILEQLGVNEQGVVLRAEDERGALVELQLLFGATTPRSRERAIREARAAGRIFHPNVARVLFAGTDPEQDVPYVVREPSSGIDLGALVKERGPLAWREAVAIALEVARGLAAAHAAGIVHRDLKPENIRVERKISVKLEGFGLARDLNSELKLTCDGAMIGTPLFMAPEIGRVKEIDGRVDLYSLGLCLYYALTGVSPLGEFTALEILSARAHAWIRPPEVHVPIPDPVRRVLGKLLAVDRDARYPDAAALIRDLDALEKGEPPTAWAEPALWSKTSPRAPVVQELLRRRVLSPDQIQSVEDFKRRVTGRKPGGAGPRAVPLHASVALAACGAAAAGLSSAVPGDLLMALNGLVVIASVVFLVAIMIAWRARTDDARRVRRLVRAPIAGFLVTASVLGVLAGMGSQHDPLKPDTLFGARALTASAFVAAFAALNVARLATKTPALQGAAWLDLGAFPAGVVGGPIVLACGAGLVLREGLTSGNDRRSLLLLLLATAFVGVSLVELSQAALRRR